MMDELQQIQQLLGQMSCAVRDRRWLTLRALDKQLHELVTQCRTGGLPQTVLDRLLASLRAQYQLILHQCRQESDVLQRKMRKHRTHREGMTAYQQIGFTSERP
jgi:DNA-binding GntR family transcriptional regulator